MKSTLFFVTAILVSVVCSAPLDLTLEERGTSCTKWGTESNGNGGCKCHSGWFQTPSGSCCSPNSYYAGGQGCVCLSGYYWDASIGTYGSCTNGQSTYTPPAVSPAPQVDTSACKSKCQSNFDTCRYTCRVSCNNGPGCEACYLGCTTTNDGCQYKCDYKTLNCTDKCDANLQICLGAAGGDAAFFTCVGNRDYCYKLC